MNKVVARFTDGRLVKGTTLDFSPGRNLLHVTPRDLLPGTAVETVHTMDLKALFFVKDFEGDPEHDDRTEFDSAPAAGEHRIKATFRDGEVLVGTTTDHTAGMPGFLLVPADPESNIDRCYVVTTATEDVRFM